MRSPAAVLRIAATLLVLPATTSAARSDLAVLRIRVPARVKLSDRRPRLTVRGAVRIANRGSVPVVVSDAATLGRVARLSAASVAGPITCAPVGIAPVLTRLRFPLTLRPGRGRTLPYDLEFTCGANPGRTPDWRFSAMVDHTALDGTADEDPTDDVCPRAPSGSDKGCGKTAAPFPIDLILK